jgi:hypothetical protein
MVVGVEVVDRHKAEREVAAEVEKGALVDRQVRIGPQSRIAIDLIELAFESLKLIALGKRLIRGKRPDKRHTCH